MDNDITKTLADRGKTHGDYHEQAKLACKIRWVFETGQKWGKLTDVQKDALLMLAVKCSRILTGDPHNPDHWHDIAGYATLAERDIHASLSSPKSIAEAVERAPRLKPWLPDTEPIAE